MDPGRGRHGSGGGDAMDEERSGAAMGLDETVRTFDQWVDEGRDEGLEIEHGDVVRQVVEQLGIRPGEKVLDLGCGTGWGTRLLAKANAGVQAIGVDASPKMIAKAEELHSFTIRARYEVGAFERLDFRDGEFDRVFSMEALYYSPDVDAALREVLRVLKPGGTADVVMDFFKESPATEKWRDIMQIPMEYLGEAEWKQRFEAAGFTGIETRRVVDRRGCVDEASFEASGCYPDWKTLHDHYAAGSLWIHAQKPA